MHTSEKLLNDIEHKKSLLHSENCAIVDKVLLYIFTNLSISQNYSKEVVNDLLDHILEAQNHGTSADEFFGPQPENFAKELVAELPKEKKSFFANLVALLIVFSVFIITSVLLMGSIPGWFKNDFEIELNLFSATVAIILYILTIIFGSYLVLHYERKVIFHPSSKSRFKEFFFYITGGLLLGPLPYIIYNHLKIGSDISFSIFIAIGLIIVSGLLTKYFSQKID